MNHLELGQHNQNRCACVVVAPCQHGPVDLHSGAAGTFRDADQVLPVPRVFAQEISDDVPLRIAMLAPSAWLNKGPDAIGKVGLEKDRV